MGNAFSSYEKGKVIVKSPYGERNEVRGKIFRNPPLQTYVVPPSYPECRKLKVPLLSVARTTDNKKDNLVKIGNQYGTAEIGEIVNNNIYINLDTLTPRKKLKGAEIGGQNMVHYKFIFDDDTEITYTPDMIERGTIILVENLVAVGGHYSKKKMRKHKKRYTTRRKYIKGI